MSAPTIAHRHHPDPARSYTLPAECYRSPDVLARERALIFAHAWTTACHVNDVAMRGAFVVVETAVGEVVVACGADGTIVAFDNLCPVRPHALVQGRGRTDAFRCGRHGVALAPGAVPEGARVWRVDRLADLVMVNPDGAAPPVARDFGHVEAELRHWVPELARLAFSTRITNDFRANWKVMVDNSVECYHCPVAHPDFTTLLDLPSYRIVNHARSATHTGRVGVASNTAYAIDAATSAPFAAWWLWPNLLFGPFPGRPNLTVHTILPTGPETAREHFDFYFLDAAPDVDEAAAIAFFRDVLRPQDVALCESVQRGLRSRAYFDGRLIDDAEGTAMSERNIHLFHGLVLTALGAD